VRASQIRTIAATPDGPSAAQAASAAAYGEAGAGPGELSLAEVHDATAVGEMGSWVDVGLCPPGSEEAWALDGHSELSGPLPVNPSGGLLARGHPLGASGLAQVYELVLQLRGDAAARQVHGARLGLAHVGGGILDGRAAVAAVHVLERPARGQAAEGAL
jgi:acetyl-CoA acetyltransferase